MFVHVPTFNVSQGHCIFITCLYISVPAIRLSCCIHSTYSHHHMVRLGIQRCKTWNRAKRDERHSEGKERKIGREWEREGGEKDGKLKERRDYIKLYEQDKLEAAWRWKYYYLHTFLLGICFLLYILSKSNTAQPHQAILSNFQTKCVI